MNLRPSNILLFVFKRVFSLSICLFILLLDINGQNLDEYKKHVFINEGFQLPYRLLKPISDISLQKFPLVVFLHGAFGKGTDNEGQLNVGACYFLREENRRQYPAYVLFPQCPPNDIWAYFENKIDSATGLAVDWRFPFYKKPTKVTDALMHLIDSLKRTGQIDASRIYIGGLSQGGMGVLDIISRYPDTFTAGFSICGAGNISTVKYFAGKVALWLFHGAKDDIVPCEFSRKYYKQLKKKKADVRYSEYANVFHNSWNNAFAEPDLLTWLFSKQKN